MIWYVRIKLAWACYYVGDATSAALTWLDSCQIPVPTWAWNFYEATMRWSGDLQGENPEGPWKPIDWVEVQKREEADGQ